MPSSLLDRLQRVLPLADKVADEIVSEETDILDKIIPRMFEVMQKIAKFLCEYVRRGRFSRPSLFWVLQMLMIAERAGDALIHSKDKEMMEEMDGQLGSVIEDFLHAIDVEALSLAKRIGKRTSSQYSLSPFSVALCRTRASPQAA